MGRKIMTGRERLKVYDAFTAWTRKDLNRRRLEETASKAGVAATSAYHSLLHLDTLAVLGTDAPLVWKGGTAIQTYLPPERQRISTDLDFNATTADVTTLRDVFAERNRRLSEKGKIVRAHGVPYGMFFEYDHRPRYGTLEYRRILPTLFNETVNVPMRGRGWGDDETLRVQGRQVVVQVNYAHHRLPALRQETASVGFFTQPAFVPAHGVHVVRASLHDLTADKILATTQHEGFGRQRFKDVYDLMALHRTPGVELALVREKLERIVGGAAMETVIDGSVRTLDVLSQEAARASGFRESVCHEGKKWVDTWTDHVVETAEWLATI